ncbi:MAG: hypothetical protein ACRDJI_06005 [Actinomycetota bacterium]
MPEKEDEGPDAYYDEAQIELNRKVAEKAAADPEFRAHIIEDPGAALESVGLADEARALAQKSAEEAGEEVSGHAFWYRTYWRTCRYWEYGIKWHWR